MSDAFLHLLPAEGASSTSISSPLPPSIKLLHEASRPLNKAGEIRVFYAEGKIHATIVVGKGEGDEPIRVAVGKGVKSLRDAGAKGVVEVAAPGKGHAAGESSRLNIGSSPSCKTTLPRLPKLTLVLSVVKLRPRTWRCSPTTSSRPPMELLLSLRPSKTTRMDPLSLSSLPKILSHPVRKGSTGRPGKSTPMVSSTLPLPSLLPSSNESSSIPFLFSCSAQNWARESMEMPANLCTPTVSLYLPSSSSLASLHLYINSKIELSFPSRSFSDLLPKGR